MASILVINPNSNEQVTAGIREAVSPFGFSNGPEIRCATLLDGPYGIESQADVEAVTLPLRDMVRGAADDGFVIACYSDPGLHVCREAVFKPVVGIAEAAISTALAITDQFGVVAILDCSIPRHLRQIRQLGVKDRLAGELALNLHVHELADEGLTYGKLTQVAERLRDECRAGSIILGCAGMARYREQLEQHIGLPVIDPVQAAVAMLIGRIAACTSGKQASQRSD